MIGHFDELVGSHDAFLSAKNFERKAKFLTDNMSMPNALRTVALDYVEEALSWIPEGANPIHQSRPLSKIQNGRSSSSGAAPFTVLVADDNADMRGYLHRVLSEHWRVNVVSSGTEALAAALADPPHLIITDVMMPGLDGFALAKALRETPTTCQIPIIMVSARAGEEARIEGLHHPELSSPPILEVESSRYRQIRRVSLPKSRQSLFGLDAGGLHIRIRRERIL